MKTLVPSRTGMRSRNCEGGRALAASSMAGSGDGVLPERRSSARPSAALKRSALTGLSK